MSDTKIIFEQPLNEYIRVCLRLEHLFHQISENICKPDEWRCRLTMDGLIDALNVIDRPDLKSKLAKALSQHASALTQLEQDPKVDKDKLAQLIHELDALADTLYKTQEKMVHELHCNTFLHTIRQQMLSPGGVSPFSTPAYQLWLQKPTHERQSDLIHWFKNFDGLKSVVRLLLQLTRESAKPISLTAINGFHHQPLDPNLPCQMIRIITSTGYQVYPEISVGRHRLSVRFYDLNLKDRAIQTAHDVNFQLVCCIL